MLTPNIKTNYYEIVHVVIPNYSMKRLQIQNMENIRISINMVLRKI